MGMINRVRARLQSLNNLTGRIDPKVQDERTAQTVCLLSVLLLLPYFITKLEPSVLLSSAGLAYSCLVLPMISAANYKYSISVLGSSLAVFKGNFVIWTSAAKRVMARTYANIERGERVYMKMSNISTMISQIIVFMLCDRILLSSDQKLSCLYSLMFYNVMAYCVNYLCDLITKDNWSNINLSSQSSIRHLAMSTTKIVLEWTRAVTFTITMVTMLLVFGLNQGLAHYHPTCSYLFITGLYYAMTEKDFAQKFPSLLASFHFEMLESLETVWGKVILKSATVVIAAILCFVGFIQGQWKLSTYALYTCVWLRLKDLHMTEMSTLKQHFAVLARYRFATQDELKEHDDVCAVCLSEFETFARITPCHHVFHGDCLRRCLQTSDLCPICKRQLKFE